MSIEATMQRAVVAEFFRKTVPLASGAQSKNGAIEDPTQAYSRYSPELAGQ
jgi:hypothetical protein